MINISTREYRVFTSENPLSCTRLGSSVLPTIDIIDLYPPVFRDKEFFPRAPIPRKTLDSEYPAESQERVFFQRVPIFSRILPLAYGYRKVSGKELKAIAGFLIKHKILQATYLKYNSSDTLLQNLTAKVVREDDTDVEGLSREKIAKHYSGESLLFMPLPMLIGVVGLNSIEVSLETHPGLYGICKVSFDSTIPVDIRGSSILGRFAFRCLPDHFRTLLGFLDEYVDGTLEKVYQIFCRAGRVTTLDPTSIAFKLAVTIAAEVDDVIMNLSTTPEELVYELFATLREARAEGLKGHRLKQAFIERGRLMVEAPMLNEHHGRGATMFGSAGYDALLGCTESKQEAALQIAKILLDHGADPYIPGYGGTIPALRGIMNGNVKIMRMLLSHPKFIFRKFLVDCAEERSRQTEAEQDPYRDWIDGIRQCIALVREEASQRTLVTRFGEEIYVRPTEVDPSLVETRLTQLEMERIEAEAREAARDKGEDIHLTQLKTSTLFSTTSHEPFYKMMKQTLSVLLESIRLHTGGFFERAQTASEDRADIAMTALGALERVAASFPLFGTAISIASSAAKAGAQITKMMITRRAEAKFKAIGKNLEKIGVIVNFAGYFTKMFVEKYHREIAKLYADNLAKSASKLEKVIKKAVDSLVDNIVSKFVGTLEAKDMSSLSEELLLDITQPTKAILPEVPEDDGAAVPDEAGPAHEDAGMNSVLVTLPGDVSAAGHDTFA